MNRTVAYQETSNNYDDTRQQIKGSQIATIKNFGVAPPSGGGDFIGQLGLAADAQGNSLLYAYGVGGIWNLVGSSAGVDLPDDVVREGLPNNFTQVDQRIEDCPITFMDSGTRVPAQVAIKGPGHIYVYESTPPKAYMSFDGADWTQLQTEHDNNGDVKLDTANDYSNPDQRIEGRSITNVMMGSVPPSIAPTREGQLYVQLASGTTERKAKLWISHTPVSSSTWEWEPLTHLYELPNTVAQTSKINDFQATQQTISGKQIISFVDGGSLTPEQSGLAADYDGQFYIATHDNVQGKKDVAVWIAEGNQWLPISQDFDLDTVVRKNRSNIYSNPNQYLTGGADARWLSGNRVKFSGGSPIADARWKAIHVGELTVYENHNVVPMEVSVWMAINVNSDPDSNVGEWAMIWSNKHADNTNTARTDRSNTFAPMQYINDGNRSHLITVAREGGAGSPKSSIVPMSSGETYTQSFSDPVHGETRHLWMSAIEGDTESWMRVHTAVDRDVVRNDQANNFTTRDQYLGDEGSTKRDRIMGSRNHTSSTSGIIGISPTMFGEVVVTKRYDPNHPSDVDKMIVEAHLAVGTGRKSWLLIGSAVAEDLEIIDDGTNN